MYGMRTLCMGAMGAQSAQVFHQDLEQQHPNEPTGPLHQDLLLLQMAPVPHQVVACRAAMLDLMAESSHIRIPPC